jgi:hypothetical protein
MFQKCPVDGLRPVYQRYWRKIIIDLKEFKPEIKIFWNESQSFDFP